MLPTGNRLHATSNKTVYDNDLNKIFLYFVFYFLFFSLMSSFLCLFLLSLISTSFFVLSVEPQLLLPGQFSLESNNGRRRPTAEGLVLKPIKPIPAICWPLEHDVLLYLNFKFWNEKERKWRILDIAVIISWHTVNKFSSLPA